MPKAETLRIRIPTRGNNVTLSRRPVVLIESSKTRDVKYVRTCQSNSNVTGLELSSTKPLVILSPQRRPWNHEAELDYSRPKDWDETHIFAYLFQNGFSIPARDPSDPWVTITGRGGEITMLPRGYRTPLLFTAKFQWESLRLVMTSASRSREWEEYKYDILHVSRLCNRLLADARSALGPAGIDKGWRSEMFDRALTRYYRRWLVNRPEFLKDFWCEFGEDEYARDVLKNDWTRFVLKGHKGFCITKEEIQKGISFEELIKGLEFLQEGTVWDPTVAKVRDAAKENPAPIAPNRRNPIPVGPIDPQDEPMDVRAAQFFKGLENRSLPTAEEFDLGRLGLRPPTLSSFSSNSSTASPSLQIKREIMEEAQVLFSYPKHLRKKYHDRIGISTLQRAGDDMAQTQLQRLPVHEPLHTRAPDPPFVRQQPHSTLPGAKSTSPIPPAPKKITPASEVRRLPSTVQYPRTVPPADVGMDDDPIDSVSDQQMCLGNEPTFADLGTVSTSANDAAPCSGDTRSEGSSSVYEARKRDRQLAFLGGGQSRGIVGESSTDVEMMVVNSAEVASTSSLHVNEYPTETLRFTPISNGWDSGANSAPEWHEIDETLRTGQDTNSIILTDVRPKLSSAPTTVAAWISYSTAKKDGAARCRDTNETTSVNADDGIRQEYNVHLEASQERPSGNSNIEEIHRSRLIHDPIHFRDPIHTNTVPETGHRKPVSQAEAPTMDSSLAINKLVSMFRDTLGGLVAIQEGVGQEEGRPATLQHTVQSSQRLCQPAPSSNSPSTQQETSLMGELLDEIKELKRQMKKNTDSKLEHNANVQRLRAQMDDLRRTVVFRDSLRHVPAASAHAQRTLSSSRTRRSPPGPTNYTRSQHPLAHLFAMEADIPQSNPPPSYIHTEAEKEESSIPGTLDPYHSPPSPTGLPNPVPLPVKSQRKYRMFLSDHQKN